MIHTTCMEIKRRLRFEQKNIYRSSQKITFESEYEKKRITAGSIKEIFCCSMLIVSNTKKKEKLYRKMNKRATDWNKYVNTKEDENVYILHFRDEFPFLNFYNH